MISSELRASRPVTAGGRSSRTAARKSWICRTWKSGKPGRPFSSRSQTARNASSPGRVQTSLIPCCPSGCSQTLTVAPRSPWTATRKPKSGLKVVAAWIVAERAVGEDDGGDRRVLDVDVGAVPQRRVPADDLDRRPHEPLELVDGVDRLVHQDAAALGRPLAAPGIGGEVLRRPPETDRALAEGQLAELAGVDRRADALRGRPEAALEDDAELDPGPLGRGDHPVGVRQPDRDRLLAEGVDPRLGGGDDDRRRGWGGACRRRRPRPRRSPATRRRRRRRAGRRTSSAMARARLGSASQQATNSASSSVLSAIAWIAAILPQPIRPVLILRDITACPLP